MFGVLGMRKFSEVSASQAKATREIGVRESNNNIGAKQNALERV
jgi:hypothetical protein